MTRSEMIEPTGSLTPELMDLMEHEKVIEQHMEGFVATARALLQIRQGKKYRAAGYKSFEGYCKGRWGWSASRGRQLIGAAETVDALESVTDVTVSPQSEWQVRPLSALRDEPEKAAAAWEAAVEDAEGEQPTAAQVEQAVAQVKAPITKPDLGGGVSHPARYTDALLPVFAELLEPGSEVLDPFAGTGKIHQLRDLGDFKTRGIELEPEWADLHEDTEVGSALDLPFDHDSFDAIVTSPCYGNRLADHHNASDPHLRRSYTHDLGRPLSPDSAGELHWGDEYRDFHRKAWAEAVRVLRPGGRFVLNIKDHIRGGDVMLVSIWHVACLVEYGLWYDAELSRDVKVGSLRSGENAEARMSGEHVLVFDKGIE